MINGTAHHYSFLTDASKHHTKPAASTAHLTHIVVNHWLHKTRYHLQRIGDRMGYLVNNGSFDSNPCSGNCLLNPIYDIMPRHEWLVEAGICQRPSEFLFDDASQSLCCPSPDYCCPNSVIDCSDERAVLFDATKARDGAPVPRAAIAGGFRQHFLSRIGPVLSQAPTPGDLSSTVCPAREWPGGLHGTRGCSMLAMTDESVEIVRDEWRRAPPWRGKRNESVPYDDDNIG